MNIRRKSLAAVVSARLAREAAVNPLINCSLSSSLSSSDQVEVFLFGQQINVKTTELILSAKEEVLMQFYNFESGSDSGKDIITALATLNCFAEANGTTIRVRMIVNMREGLAAYFTTHADDPFAWLENDEKGKFINTGEKKIYLEHLDIETKLHEHHYFDSYHSKQIIVDRKHLMLRSGDISKYSNSKSGKLLRIEMATVLNSEGIARFAAKNFYNRWNGFQQELKFLDVKADGDIPVLFMEKAETTNPLIGFTYQAPMKIAIEEALTWAVRCVKIMTPNLNDSDYIDYIIAAVKRGLRVQILTGKFMNEKRESKPGMGGTNKAAIYKIYDALPMMLWDKCQVRWACNEEKELILDNTANTLHCKAMIVDDCAVITGSSPLDRQAAFFSSECDALIESPLVAEKYLTHIFNPLFNDGEDCVAMSLVLIKHLLIKSVGIIAEKKAFKGFCNAGVLIDMIKAIDSFTSLSAAIHEAFYPQPIEAGISRQGLFADSLQRKLLSSACVDCDIQVSARKISASMSHLDM